MKAEIEHYFHWWRAAVEEQTGGSDAEIRLYFD
jgi:hypothetical protein